MNYNFYKEKEQQLGSYKTQIVVSFFVILSLILSISVVKDLYYQTKYNHKYFENRIYKKTRLSSIIVLLSAVYFVYVSFKTYKKEPSKNNFLFLVAAELALIAAIIRYLNINRNDITNIESAL